MKDPNTAPLFYVDNLQKIEGDNQYTVDLHLPENFSYTDYKVIGNSQVVHDILKIEIYLRGAKNITPSTFAGEVCPLCKGNLNATTWAAGWQLSCEHCEVTGVVVEKFGY